MVADQILAFYQSLEKPNGLPLDIKTLNPYQTTDGWKSTIDFYNKYYFDNNSRRILFGINPGRLGGGVTGIPFTDPVALDVSCNIKNPFNKRAELSSKFIYEMITALGGPEIFYKHYFITGVSPLGFIRDDKNLNYYDIKGWRVLFENDMVKWIENQLKFNIDCSVAFSIGKGENLKFLKKLNTKYQFFEEIRPLPHPRWVMQYRLKSKDIFIQEYEKELKLTH